MVGFQKNEVAEGGLDDIDISFLLVSTIIFMLITTRSARTYLCMLDNHGNFVKVFVGWSDIEDTKAKFYFKKKKMIFHKQGVLVW